MSLVDDIVYFESTPRIIEQWNNLKALLKNSENDISLVDIPSIKAMRFKADFYGLLKHEFNIEEIYWYPHLIVNDFNAPTDYHERIQVIKLIRHDTLEDLYNRIKL